MSRRSRFGKKSGEQREQNAAEEKTPQGEGRPERPREGVLTLKLGGRSPLKAFNAYLITGQKHILVDPGPPGTAGELLEQLSRQRISLGDIGLIVLTHGHPDHFGNALQLKDWTRAPLAVHELDSEYVHWGGAPALKPVTRLGSLMKRFSKLKADPVEPDIILQDGDRLGRYAGRGRVILTPGHTAGSLSILLPDGTCIAGDLLMGGLRRSRPSYPWFAENLTEVRESLQRVVDAGARTLLVGHGGPFNVVDLPKAFPWLKVDVEALREDPARGDWNGEDGRSESNGGLVRSEPGGSPVRSEPNVGSVRSDRPGEERGERTGTTGQGGEEDRPRRSRPRRRRPSRRRGPQGEAPPQGGSGS
ncbi:MBL fold metallo-hydrolase [Chloroflexota bacterium]